LNVLFVMLLPLRHSAGEIRVDWTYCGGFASQGVRRAKATKRRCESPIGFVEWQGLLIAVVTLA
jgi:hypothetical protein